MYQRILVPLDGSELAEKALPEAERLARLTGAPVRLIRVVDMAQLPWYGTYGMAMELAAVESALADEETLASSYLKTIAGRLTQAGLTVETEVLRGPTARALVLAAKEGDAIVMASHGRGGISRWILGSIAEELLRHAPVPILLIKAGKATSNRDAVEPEMAAAV